MCNFLEENSFLLGRPGASFTVLEQWMWWHLDHDGAKTQDSHLRESPRYPNPGWLPSNWCFPMERFSVASLHLPGPTSSSKSRWAPWDTPPARCSYQLQKTHRVPPKRCGGRASFSDWGENKAIGKHPANSWALVKRGWAFLTPSAPDWEMLS